MDSKPITVARQQFIEQLCSIVNNSGLPAFVISDVLERVLFEVKTLAKAELQRDMEQYKSRLQSKDQ